MQAVGKKLAFVLEEIFKGHATGCLFLDDGTPGLISMIDGLSAAEASTPAAGLCIASHVKHVAFSLEAYLRAVREEDYAHIVENWPDWTAFRLTEAEWEALKQELAANYAALHGLLLEGTKLEGRRLDYALGALAHMAFHLGAVEVKYDHLKAGTPCPQPD